MHGCPDKKSARQELARRLEQVNSNNGVVAPPRALRFSELVDKHWPQYLDNAKVKRSTRYSYRSMLEQWIVPFFGERQLAEIVPVHVSDFMASLIQAGLSAKYRRNIYNLLKVLFELAVESDLMAASPLRPKIHRPKVEQKEKPVISVDQARALLRELDPDWRAPIVTLALTGLRAGELLGLRWKDIDFLNRRITVSHSLWRRRLESPKTQASKARVAMPEALVRILADHRAGSDCTDADDFVFCRADGSPLDPDSLRRLGIYPAMKRAGIPFVKRASGCHAFRHLAGSIVHDQTGSLKLAQKQLRHATVTTTGNIYTHVREEKLDDLASILGEALGEFCCRTVVETSSERNLVQ